MLGTGFQFSTQGEDQFCHPANARKHQPNDPLRSAQSDISPSQSPLVREMIEKQVDRDPGNRITLKESVKLVSVPAFEPVVSPLSNLERFLESITPSVPLQYLPKMTMRGWRICDVELRPYFVLGDLWESFKEWSAYGAGVPVMLNDSDSFVQYYVPYLSGIQIYGIQIYGESMKTCAKSRRPYEDSGSDFRDSSSDGSSNCGPDSILKASRKQWNYHHLTNEVTLTMDTLPSRDHQITHQEDCSSDDGESLSSQGCLLFEYLERDPPYSREPLADKVSNLQDTNRTNIERTGCLLSDLPFSSYTIGRCTKC